MVGVALYITNTCISTKKTYILLNINILYNNIDFLYIIYVFTKRKYKILYIKYLEKSIKNILKSQPNNSRVGRPWALYVLF